MRGEKLIRKQAKLIDRLSGNKIKFNPSRISIYRGDRYVGWVDRGDYHNLRRNSQGTVKTSKISNTEFYRTSFNPIVLDKRVRIKTDDMERPINKNVKIFTYTRQQRSYVVRSFMQRRLPMTKPQFMQKVVAEFDMRKIFGKLGIRITKATRIS